MTRRAIAFSAAIVVVDARLLIGQATPDPGSELDKGWRGTAWQDSAWGSDTTSVPAHALYKLLWKSSKPFADRLTMSDSKTEYLGFKLDDSTFRTCRGEVVTFGAGCSVTETKEQCPDDSPLPLLYGYWTVRSVDSTAKKLFVGSSSRPYQAVFLVGSWSGQQAVSTLKAGDQVAIVAVDGGKPQDPIRALGVVKGSK